MTDWGTSGKIYVGVTGPLSPCPSDTGPCVLRVLAETKWTYLDQNCGGAIPCGDACTNACKNRVTSISSYLAYTPLSNANCRYDTTEREEIGHKTLCSVPLAGGGVYVVGASTKVDNWGGPVYNSERRRCELEVDVTHKTYNASGLSWPNWIFINSQPITVVVSYESLPTPTGLNCCSEKGDKKVLKIVEGREITQLGHTIEGFCFGRWQVDCRVRVTLKTFGPPAEVLLPDQ